LRHAEIGYAGLDVQPVGGPDNFMLASNTHTITCLVLRVPRLWGDVCPGGGGRG
jgi:hypothetical protein